MNPWPCREVRRRLLLRYSAPGERAAQLVAHAALGRMPVEALDERAAVGVTELVGDHLRRQATLHEERRAGVAQLVELDLVAAGPALPDGACLRHNLGDRA